MRKMKIAVLLMAVLAMLASLTPLVAVDDQQDYGSGGSGGGSGAWKVTCNYNGSEQLVSKSCTSGGNMSCNCG